MCNRCIEVHHWRFWLQVKSLRLCSLVRTPGDRRICSPYPEFVLTGVLSIKKVLKGTETVFVLTRIRKSTLTSYSIWRIILCGNTGVQ